MVSQARRISLELKQVFVPSRDNHSSEGQDPATACNAALQSGFWFCRFKFRSTNRTPIDCIGSYKLSAKLLASSLELNVQSVEVEAETNLAGYWWG